MIKRVFSTHQKFRSPSFENGLNLFVADKAEGSTEKQTRNSAGKSSLLEIVHFIFGADVDASSFFKNEEFEECLFNIEIEQEGYSYTVSRSTSKPSRVYFDKRVDIDLGFDLELEKDDEMRLYYASIAEWKKAAGKFYFDIPIFAGDNKYSPSFRSILSYFTRRDISGGMLEPKKNVRQQQPYDEQVSLSYLLGLDWTLSRDLQLLRDKEKALKELKKSLKQGLLDAFMESPATLRSQIAVLEGKIKTAQNNLSTFNLLPEYRQYEDELTKINIEIKRSIDSNTLDKELLHSLEDSILEAESPSYDSLQQLYQESIQLFPDIVKKRFEEVQVFHDSVIKNRKLYLESEIARVKNEIKSREKVIGQFTQRQTFVMNLLQTHGALEQYNKLNTDLLNKQADLVELRKRLKIALDIEDAKPRLDMERAALSLRMTQNIEENNDKISHAIQRFESISSSLFEKAGMLTVENAANGIEIGVSKQGDRSKGIKSMQIYCFDMTLISLLREQGKKIDFLVHDSHLFDPVDSRQIVRALITGKLFAEQYGFQYIVTMNSDQIPYEFLPEDFDVNSIVVEPRLDDTDDGGLFGFRF